MGEAKAMWVMANTEQKQQENRRQIDRLIEAFFLGEQSGKWMNMVKKTTRPKAVRIEFAETR